MRGSAFNGFLHVWRAVLHDRWQLPLVVVAQLGRGWMMAGFGKPQGPGGIAARDSRLGGGGGG